VRPELRLRTDGWPTSSFIRYLFMASNRFSLFGFNGFVWMQLRARGQQQSVDLLRPFKHQPQRLNSNNKKLGNER